MLRGRGHFWSGEARQYSVGDLVRVAFKNGVVAVAVGGISEVYELHVLVSSGPAGDLRNPRHVVAVELGVDHEQPATSDDLLQHHQPGKSRFSIAASPRDHAVVRQRFVWEPNGTPAISRIPDQHAIV